MPMLSQSPSKGGGNRAIGFPEDDEGLIMDDSAVLNLDVRSSRRRPSRKFTR